MSASYYSSQDDLNLDSQRLIELTEDESAVGVLVQSVLDNLSNDAQALIDGELYGEYLVPFVVDEVPVAIRYLHADIWRYLLFKRRDSLVIPASVAEDMKQARTDLRAFAERTKLLPAPTAAASTAPGIGYGSFSADVADHRPAERLFGRFRDKLG